MVNINLSQKQLLTGITFLALAATAGATEEGRQFVTTICGSFKFLNCPAPFTTDFFAEAGPLAKLVCAKAASIVEPCFTQLLGPEGSDNLLGQFCR